MIAIHHEPDDTLALNMPSRFFSTIIR